MSKPPRRRGNFIVVCQHCRDEFRVERGRADSARYCSRQCQNDHTRHADDTAFSPRTPKVAYWAGFMMADGSVVRHRSSTPITLAIHEKDLSHLLAYARFIGCDLTPRRHSKNNWLISISSSKMAADLAEWGIVPNKTYIGSVPDDIPGSLLPHYVRGIVDGDGCIHIRDDGRRPIEWSIVVINNEAVIRWLAETMVSLFDAHPKVSIARKNRKTGHVTYRLSLHRKSEVTGVLSWLQYDQDVVALERKRELALRIIGPAIP